MRMEVRHLPTLQGYAGDQFKGDNVMKIILESVQGSANVVSVIINNKNYYCIVDKGNLPANLNSRVSSYKNQLKGYG